MTTRITKIPLITKEEIQAIETIFKKAVNSNHHSWIGPEPPTKLIEILDCPPIRKLSPFRDIKGLIPLLDKYLPHSDWRFRICGVWLLCVLTDEVIQMEVHSRELKLVHPLETPQSEIPTRFWELVIEGDPKILTYWAYFIRYLRRQDPENRYRWIDEYQDTFIKPALTEERLRTLDLSQLFQTYSKLYDMHNTVYTEIFWALICMIDHRIRLGEGVQLTPLVVRLIELLFQKEPLLRESPIYTYTRQHLTNPSIPLLQALRLVWKLQPSYHNISWLQLALDLFEDIKKTAELGGAYDFWIGKGADSFYDDLVLAIIHSRDVNVLSRYHDLCVLMSAPDVDLRHFPIQRHRRLYSYTLKMKWQTGALRLLFFLAEWYTIYYDSKNVYPEDFTPLIIEGLDSYLTIWKDGTPPLLSTLKKAYQFAVQGSSIYEIPDAPEPLDDWDLPDFHQAFKHLQQYFDQFNSPI